MKCYKKPGITVTTLSAGCLASLSQWLTENELTDAGITTYIIAS